jgi:membrane-bound metal-dependent hydrolase YbcI (DUF457 family)
VSTFITHAWQRFLPSIFVIPLIAIHFFAWGVEYLHIKQQTEHQKDGTTLYGRVLGPGQKIAIRSLVGDICGCRAVLIKLASGLFPPFIGMIGTAAHITLDYKTRLPAYDVEGKQKSFGVKY